MEARTLRQWAGLTPPASLPTTGTAVVFIDLQMDYFTPGKLLIPDGDAVIANAVRLRDWAVANGWPVAHVQQMAPATSPLFAAGCAGGEFHPAMAPRPGERLVPKTLPSSFQRTELHEWLQAHGVTTLVLAGLMTHMCVETTARDALPLGYAVIVVADACATRDLPSPSGGVLTHELVHQVALAELADRFADVLTTAAVLALPLVD